MDIFGEIVPMNIIYLYIETNGSSIRTFELNTRRRQWKHNKTENKPLSRTIVFRHQIHLWRASVSDL